MSATVKLTVLEGKLFLREPIALFFGLVFPTVLLLALGYFIPGFDEPATELDGARFIDIYSPIALALGLATLALVTLPPVLSSYRQFGILRRLQTTPIHPARLLTAQLVVNLIVAVLAAIMAIVAVVAAFDVPVPQRPLWFALSFLLTALCMLSFGMLVGAVARSSASATAIGMALYFPMLFFAGVWIPRSVMSEGLRSVSDVTPLGAAVQALEDSWFGEPPDPLSLAVLTVYTLIVGVLAVRVFRWD
jgi:ABC-2 type transport system permease protein